MPTSIPAVVIEGVQTPASPIPPEAIHVSISGESYLCFFEGEEIPPLPAQESVPAPQWREFRLAMLQSEGFQRISAAVDAVNFRLQSRLETTIAQTEPHLPALQSFWSEIIQICPPTAPEIDQFRQIAAQNFIPINFGETGEILV